jgi:ribosomal-protein-alanine N-acetyltransferase
VIIRPATADDAAEVADLELRLFGADAWSPASVREELTGPRRRALVARTSRPPGRLLGYVVTAAAGDTVDLQRIGVDPASQRRGIARDLLRRVSTGRRMLLEVSAENAAARAFYTAAGFVEVGRRRRYYRDGSDAVVMQHS